MQNTIPKTSAPPTFIFTSGPGAGGALLQNMLSASQELLVWSGSGGALHHTLEGLRQMDFAATPTMMKMLTGGRSAAVKKKIPRGTDVRPMVGSLRLGSSHLFRAYRVLFSRLYEAPSRAHGFQRWGLIETSGDRFTADMLKLLFPDARLIFLVRDPLACLREIRARKLQPRDGWGKTVAANRIVWFAEQWSAVARDFSKVDDGLRIRYEDLLDGSVSTAFLSEFLNISIPADFVARWSADSKSRTDLPELDTAAREKILPLVREQRRHWKYV